MAAAGKRGVLNVFAVNPETKDQSLPITIAETLESVGAHRFFCYSLLSIVLCLRLRRGDPSINE